MKKTKIIATFMIFLVLTIPVFTGAQSLTLDKYSGKDGVNGVIRDRDTLSVEVIAKRSDGGAVSNEDVWLASKIGKDYVAEYAFKSCSPLPDGNNKCIYSEDDPLPDDYQVQLRENNQVADTKEFTLISDEADPNVELSYSLEEGKLQVNYDIDDGEKCSGIKSVDFYIKKGTQRSASFKTIPGKKGECQLRDSFEITYSAGQQSVQGQLCAKVTDYFGKSYEGCADTDFVYDKKPPTIKSAKLLSEDGLDLTHIKNSGDISAQLVVEVEGDTNSAGEIDVTKDTITADLSAMNSDEKERKVDRVDSQKSNTFIWDFTLKNTEDCRYIIKAADKQGNKAADVTKTCTLSLDTTPPTISSVSTIPEVLGTKGGNITIIFGDADDEGSEGVGISGGNVQISVEDVKLSSKSPNDCPKINGEWKCDWKVSVPAGTESGDKKITIYARDNIGNSMEAEDKIKVDLAAPEGSVVEYSVIGGEDQSIPYPVIGDTIKFVIKGSKDVNSAEADFTPLKGSKQTVICDKECAFTYTLKTGTPLGTKTIKFVAIDRAGNTEPLSKQVTIYDTVKGKPKKEGYWDVKGVTCMPSKIDRLTVSQFGDFSVYCQVELLARDSSAEVASVTVKQKDCTGDFVKNNVKSVEIIPNNENPYLVFTLEKKEFNESTASISCPITIYTLKNNKLDKNSEKETVESVLNFHLDSLGDIYSTNEKRIKDAIDKTEWDKDLIGKLKEILGWFEKICQLKTVLVGLISVWQFLHFAWVGAETFAAVAGPAGKIPARAERVASCLAKESSQSAYANSWLKYLDPFCSALSCRSSTGGGVEKWGSYIGGNYNPLCADLDKLLNTPEFKVAMGQMEKIKNEGITGQKEDIQVLSVKESIVWSTFCFCPAGIVHNLDKAKQIDCRYATCLIEDVKEKGISPDACKQMRSEMKCAYWFGEIWNALPYTQLFDKFVNLISQIFTDPVKLLSVALGLSCKANCYLEPPTVSTTCGLATLASSIGEAVATTTDAIQQKGIWSKETSNDYCAKLDTLKDTYKEKKAEAESEEE